MHRSGVQEKFFAAITDEKVMFAKKIQRHPKEPA
jgi:hypothetical protein